MADIEVINRPVYLAKTKGRCYLSPKSAANAEARAILALRPQAVPMTPKVRQQWRFIRDRLNTPGMYQDSVGKFVEWFEAHHRITAPAGGEKQA